MARSATVLERAVTRGQQGEVSPEVVLWTLAAGPVVILNDGDLPQGEFPPAPLVLQRDGNSFLAVFTQQDRAGDFLDGRVAVAVPAFELLRRIPVGVGLVVNPGQPEGFEVPADGLRAFSLTLMGQGTGEGV